MDFVKRNITLLSASVVAVGLIAVIMFYSHQYKVRASEDKKKYDEAVEFLKDVRREDYAVTSKSLEAAEFNEKFLKKELHKVKKAVGRYEELQVQDLDGIECKNYLAKEVQKLRRELRKNGVSVQGDTAYFTFKNVIESDQIPDAEKEVPGLLRKFEIMREIVEQIAASHVSSVNDISVQTRGVKVGDKYKVTKFSLEVEAKLAVVKKMVNNFHQKGDLYFYVPYVNFAKSRDLSSLLENRPEISTEEESESTEDRGAGRDKRAGNEEGRSDSKSSEAARRDEKAEKLTKRERRIRLGDVVVASMPLHYIEFIIEPGELPESVANIDENAKDDSSESDDQNSSESDGKEGKPF